MDGLTVSTIRGYELRQRLGAGGFGVVYRAFQPAVDREVAVKVILPEYANRPEFIRRFELEAQLVARLEHPHIVPLYDYWREPDGAYLVMRYLRGGSLRDALRRGLLDPQAAERLLDQVAQALAVAHRQRIIHRDIKPENILLDDEGNFYLSDFGIAKDLLHDSEATRSGLITGSPAYISPSRFSAARWGRKATSQPRRDDAVLTGNCSRGGARGQIATPDRAAAILRAQRPGCLKREEVIQTARPSAPNNGP
jgi:serine/threonine protein kinase